MIGPEASIRRFDVFAEYTRLESLREGLAADEAKGYAIWLAKVVAARKFGRLKPDTRKSAEASREELAERAGRKFRSLSGIEQTDAVFDKDIITRMGRSFYIGVFSPAIKEAFEKGKPYRQIRDSIREAWKT